MTGKDSTDSKGSKAGRAVFSGGRCIFALYFRAVFSRCILVRCVFAFYREARMKRCALFLALCLLAPCFGCEPARTTTLPPGYHAFQRYGGKGFARFPIGRPYIIHASDLDWAHAEVLRQAEVHAWTCDPEAMIRGRLRRAYPEHCPPRWKPGSR